MPIIARHIQHESVPPSERAGVALPPELERVVMACLAMQPESRPRGAKELASPLRAVPRESWSDAQAETWRGKSLPRTGCSAHSVPTGHQPRSVEIASAIDRPRAGIQRVLFQYPFLHSPPVIVAR